MMDNFDKPNSKENFNPNIILNLQLEISNKMISIGEKITKILELDPSSEEFVMGIFTAIDKINGNGIINSSIIKSENGIEDFIKNTKQMLIKLEDNVKIEKSTLKGFMLFKDFNDLIKLLFELKDCYKKLEIETDIKIDEGSALLNIQNIAKLYNLSEDLREEAIKLDKKTFDSIEKKLFLIEDSVAILVSDATLQTQKENIQKYLQSILKIISDTKTNAKTDSIISTINAMIALVTQDTKKAIQEHFLFMANNTKTYHGVDDGVNEFYNDANPLKWNININMAQNSQTEHDSVDELNKFYDDANPLILSMDAKNEETQRNWIDPIRKILVDTEGALNNASLHINNLLQNPSLNDQALKTLDKLIKITVNELANKDSINITQIRKCIINLHNELYSTEESVKSQDPAIVSNTIQILNEILNEIKKTYSKFLDDISTTIHKQIETLEIKLTNELDTEKLECYQQEKSALLDAEKIINYLVQDTMDIDFEDFNEMGDEANTNIKTKQAPTLNSSNPNQLTATFDEHGNEVRFNLDEYALQNVTQPSHQFLDGATLKTLTTLLRDSKDKSNKESHSNSKH